MPQSPQKKTVCAQATVLVFPKPPKRSALHWNSIPTQNCRTRDIGVCHQVWEEGTGCGADGRMACSILPGASSLLAGRLAFPVPPQARLRTLPTVFSELSHTVIGAT